MQTVQNNSSVNPELTNENSSEPRIGFGAADNVEQNEFDREQLGLSREQLKRQVAKLVELYRKQKPPK
jgi:hypothetical protein